MLIVANSPSCVVTFALRHAPAFFFDMTTSHWHKARHVIRRCRRIAFNMAETIMEDRLGHNCFFQHNRVNGGLFLRSEQNQASTLWERTISQCIYYLPLLNNIYVTGVMDAATNVICFRINSSSPPPPHRWLRRWGLIHVMATAWNPAWFIGSEKNWVEGFFSCSTVLTANHSWQNLILVF